MDQNQVVPDQLPDENYIERLFPKCPPKQQQQAAFYGDKRASLTNRSGNAGNTSGSKGGPKRQARCKVQQHSRRELEARRNKVKQRQQSTASFKDNNNNNNFNSNNGHSSDSSDEINRRNGGSLRRNGGSSLQYGGAGNFQKSANQTIASSSSVSNSLDSPQRRSGKYTASQSLLQQLQRSQSSYNSNNINSSSSNNNGSTNISVNADMLNGAESSEAFADCVKSKRVSGIVKSASSFSFLNETTTTIPNSSVSQVAPSNKCQFVSKNTKLTSQRAYETDCSAASAAGACLPASVGTTTSSAKQPLLEAATKNDDSQSDLFDNTNEYPYKSSTTETIRPRGLKAANSLSFISVESDSVGSVNRRPQNDKHMTQDSMAMNSDNNNSTTRNNESRRLQNSRANLKLYADDMKCTGVGGESMLMDMPVTHCPPAANACSSIGNYNSGGIISHQPPIQTTAVSAESHERNDIAKKDLSAVDSNPSIVSQSQQQLVSSHINNGSGRTTADQRSSLENLDKKHDSETIDDSPPNRSKDDDKYINLFVYDNATNNLLRSRATEESDRQYQLQQQQQAPHSKGAKYRPRGKRFSNRVNYMSKENEDLSFESQRDNIEITEIIEEEETQPTAASGSEEPTPSSPPLPSLISSASIQGQGESEQSIQQNLEKAAPNIISIHHQASQRLLTTDFIDNDDGIVRHDASTEELCNTSDSLDETKKCINPKKTNQESESLLSKRSDSANNRSHRVPPSTVGILQTVDEKAEIISEESGEVVDDEDLEKITSKQTSDTMPANQLNFTKKGFVPPGHPQRIRLLTPATEVNDQTVSSSSSMISPSSARDVRPAGILTDKLVYPDTELSSLDRSAIRSHTKAENQRVKFDDENLVSVRDSHGRSIQHQILPNETTSSIMKRNDHPPQMPSISEAQYESELEIRNEEFSDGDLTVGLNKMKISSLSNIQNNLDEIPYRSEATSSENTKHLQLPREKSNSTSYVTHELQSTQPIDTRVPNLRHHKLPNETSHYSIVRSSNNGCSNNGDGNNVHSRSSSIQFNTLSDGESGPDDGSPGNSTTARTYPQPTKKCDSTQGLANRNCIGISSTKNSNNTNDDDMMPTTKTALIFPRLDEGLSSEAESCDDEVDDDDEKAVDADVDADDDDDNDIDDDLDNDNLSLDKSTLQLNQSTVDCFLRQQQQQQPQQHQHQSKPQNRLIVSSPQHCSPLIGIMTDQSELHQSKVAASAYGGYINQEPLDHNDLKSMSGYSNHNGQSNYWTGVSSNQPNMSSQPSSSQNFTQRNHNNHPTSKNNNSFTREEAKATNRLSSDTDNETDRLLGTQRNDQLKLINNEVNSNNSTDLQPVSNVMKHNANSREVLIEGVLFNVKYLGSTHSDCEGRSEKEDRIHQAEMAVHEVKFRNGESQSAAEVQLFISTEKIMVLDDKNRKIMMDHSLRTISYIADIGDAIVLIVRKKNSNSDVTNELGRPVSKISCHVFESSESHTITKSISQAFQVAYTELLKANGTGDTNSYLPKELDYQEVLNSQEMSTDELEMFARKENQREVIVPKEKGEILGLSIVESGWGSVLPTVVIANLKHDGPAYRCKKLSIGDQILSVNGISLVGLPMAECQEILRKTKKQSVARLSVVPCPITVEVKIKRPDTKYQLGFSVQNGVICSLLRGGIAERGGVRVGHRIMSINGTAVVGVPHEKIVTLLANSVGEIRMKTCLTSLYRLILGEEKAVHF